MNFAFWLRGKCILIRLNFDSFYGLPDLISANIY